MLVPLSWPWPERIVGRAGSRRWRRPRRASAPELGPAARAEAEEDAANRGGGRDSMPRIRSPRSAAKGEAGESAWAISRFGRPARWSRNAGRGRANRAIRAGSVDKRPALGGLARQLLDRVLEPQRGRLLSRQRRISHDAEWAAGAGFVSARRCRRRGAAIRAAEPSRGPMPQLQLSHRGSAPHVTYHHTHGGSADPCAPISAATLRPVRPRIV